MHTIELWRWRVTDPVTGRVYRTLHRMTAADALAIDPKAQRIEHTLELRTVPDGPHEFQHTNASGPRF
jgi:hypothetical protein